MPHGTTFSSYASQLCARSEETIIHGWDLSNSCKEMSMGNAIGGVCKTVIENMDHGKNNTEVREKKERAKVYGSVL